MRIDYLHLPHRRLPTPRNRSACLWHLLNLVSRGHRYHTSGLIRDEKKVLAFVEKMHEHFGVLLSPSGKRKRHARGIPTAHLVMYKDWDGVWLWWLLFAGDESHIYALARTHHESLHDATRSDGRLSFREEYILRTRQRTREHGGGSAWTWFMSKPVANAVESELVSLAAAHGCSGARTDDLERAVTRLRQRPMFGGVRQQASVALLRTMRVWVKTHGVGHPCPGYLTEPLPWFDGRIKIMA